VSLQRKPPQRRITDHYHPDLWSVDQQHRHEDALTEELKEIRTEMRSLSNRMLMLIGALGLIAFAVPVVAPFVRSLIVGVP
jgi:hypothetical protein